MISVCIAHHPPELWFCCVWSPTAGLYKFRAALVCCEHVPASDPVLQHTLTMTGFQPTTPGNFFRMRRDPNGPFTFENWDLRCSVAFGEPFASCSDIAGFDFITSAMRNACLRGMPEVGSPSKGHGSRQ